MADVIMPKMSDSMEEGKVLRWIKSQGDQVEKGEPIAEIETDKANVELESPDSGVLTEIDASEGDTVDVGTVIARIGVESEIAGTKGGAAAPPEAPPAEEQAAPPPQEEPQVEASRAEAPPSPPQPPAPEPFQQREQVREPEETEILRASPLARRIAQDAGVDLFQITGSGPAGRIVESDVREFIARGAKGEPAAPAQPVERAPETPKPQALTPTPTPSSLTGRMLEVGRIWQIVGERTQASKREAPHFYVTIEADMEEALRMREWMNASRPEGKQISVNDIIVKACAVALLKHPTLNSSFLDRGHIRIHDTVNIGIAVALPNGLVVPVVRNCERKTLSVIADEARELIARTRAGNIRPEEYEGGTFTVSNLGMYGVDEFIAIINSPQSAILAVGAAMPKVVVKDGEMVIRNAMRMTVSGDHRATDGARVAEFMRDLKALLEQPVALLE